MTPQEAHNDYLELLSSGGLIGFAIGVWFVVVVVREIRKNLSVDSGFIRAVRFGAVLGLAGVAAHSLVDFGLHITINALVFVTLIMMATMRIRKTPIQISRRIGPLTYLDRDAALPFNNFTRDLSATGYWWLPRFSGTGHHWWCRSYF